MSQANLFIDNDNDIESFKPTESAQLTESFKPTELSQPTKSTESIKYTELDLKTSAKDCLSYILFVIILLGIIGIAIAYIVYIITSLCETSYSEQKKMCSKSNAWLFLLLSLIVNSIVTSKSGNKAKSNDDTKSNDLILELLVSLGFTIWGCYELFGVKCVGELSHTLLYTMLQISVITDIVIFGFVILFGFCSCFISSIFTSSDQVN